MTIGDAFLGEGTSSRVSSAGASVLTCSVRSNPSSVSWRRGAPAVPALLIIRSIDGTREARALAVSRTRVRWAKPSTDVVHLGAAGSP